MTATKVAAFMRQPSTVLGISTLIGTFTAMLTAQITWQSAVPAIAGAVAAILLPDDGRAQVAIKNAATAVVMAEQDIANSSTKETIVLDVTKTAMTLIFLVITGIGLSAYAAQPATQVRALADFPAPHAVTHAAGVTYATAWSNDAPIEAAEAAVVAGVACSMGRVVG